MCVCEGGAEIERQREIRGHLTGLLSPTTRVLGIELRSSSLVACAFTHETILSANINN